MREALLYRKSYDVPLRVSKALATTVGSGTVLQCLEAAMLLEEQDSV